MGVGPATGAGVGAGVGAPQSAAPVLAAADHAAPPRADGRQHLPPLPGGTHRGVLGYTGPGNESATGGVLEAERSPFAAFPPAAAPPVAGGAGQAGPVLDGAGSTGGEGSE